MANSSVPEWLDSIDAGYGSKFACCFEDIGVTNVADVPKYIGDKELVELTESLRNAGGKGVHIAKIEAAIADLKGTGGSTMTPHRPNVPARSASNPRTNAHSSAPAPTGKRYVCFLSHHKADCAMEARFLKNQLQDLLGAEVFLDSDGTFRPASFSQLTRVHAADGFLSRLPPSRRSARSHRTARARPKQQIAGARAVGQRAPAPLVSASCNNAKI
jgi:hypothetical protein